MKQLDYIRDFLFLLIVIYFSQGALYAEGSMISQGVLLMILVISGIYFIKTNLLKNRPFYFRVLTIVILLNIFGFIFTGDYSNPRHFDMFKSILSGLLPFYPFYYFARRGYLKERHLIRFFILILLVSILGFYNSQSKLLAENEWGATDVVNNMSYIFVNLIPYIFLFKKKKILSAVSIFILLFFIIQGAKRGALIAGVIGALYFVYYQLSTIEKKNRFKGYLVVIIGIIALSVFFYDFYQSNQFLVERMSKIGEDGGTSGRDIIYANIFNSWYGDDSFIHFLFGFGFAGSLLISGIGVLAHNDWLELLSNFGLLGVVIYAILFFSAIKFVLNNKNNKENRILMLTVVTIWFAITLFSMSYTAQTTVYQSVIMAFLIGSINNTKSK